MLKRKIDKYLEEWKVSIDKKPLIVRGARHTLHPTLYTKKSPTEAIFCFFSTKTCIIQINVVSLQQNFPNV